MLITRMQNLPETGKRRNARGSGTLVKSLKNYKGYNGDFRTNYVTM